MGGRSAVIVPITLPVRLADVRAASDRAALLGVPAHVTILFPFMAVGNLGEAERAGLWDIAGRFEPFVARFGSVERRDGMVWLVPDDQAPLLAMTAAVLDRWPDHQPYGGVHETLIAHLTLVESEDAEALGRAEVLAHDVGPFEAAVGVMLLITEARDGSWRTRWRFRLAEGSAHGGRC